MRLYLFLTSSPAPPPPLRPVKAIHVMSQIIQDVDVDPIHQMQMSQNLTTFEDILGGCERLLRAPIPVSYTR